jgi:hypothetical protein
MIRSPVHENSGSMIVQYFRLPGGQMIQMRRYVRAIETVLNPSKNLVLHWPRYFTQNSVHGCTMVEMCNHED